MSDAVQRRLQRAAEGIAACREDRTTTPPGVAAYLELRDGKETREYLEAVAKSGYFPEWPPWPPEADGYHHAWVREHWTPEAAEAFDFYEAAGSELRREEADVLAWEVAGGATLADACVAADLEPPAASFTGSAREYVASSYPVLLHHFDSCAGSAHHGHENWPPSEPVKMREGNRRRLAEAQRRFYDPTDDERARVVERRPGVHIRGDGYEWRAHVTYWQDLAKAAGDLASR
jgi:hypothetical protein